MGGPVIGFDIEGVVPFDREATGIGHGLDPAVRLLVHGRYLYDSLHGMTLKIGHIGPDWVGRLDVDAENSGRKRLVPISQASLACIKR